jgi:glutamate-1-semialdehyde 2,1-aminomutase
MTEDGFDLPNGVAKSERLHRAATDVFPGGVSHDIRYFEPHPIYVDRTEGGRVWDVDGNEYVDFWMNHVTSVLGHAHPDVVEAVRDQIERGFHYGTPNEPALELGRKITEYVPSAERVRFCGSGTEATMYAIRLARAHAERPHVLKVEGGWHGGNTDLADAIHAPFDEPESVGLPPGVPEYVHSFPLGDREALTELLDSYEVGGMILEPMLLAGGGVEADEEFLRFVREETRRRDVVLIFDEVVTGFRVSPGSYQARVDVTPDLTTLGKFLGGGLPAGALAGRADIVERSRPDYEGDDPVLAGGGTFSMNPATAAAGLASLDVVESEPVYDYTESQGARIRGDLATTFEALGIEVAVLGTSSLFLNHFDPDGPITTVAGVETGTDRAALDTFQRRLIERGYYLLPGHMGAVSYQTTEDQIDGFLAAAEKVAREMRDEGLL